VQVFNKLEDNLKLCSYRSEFFKYLALSGYTVVPPDEHLGFATSKPQLQLVPMVKARPEWDQVPVIDGKDQVEVAARFYGGTASPEQKMMMQKKCMMESPWLIPDAERPPGANELLFKHVWLDPTLRTKLRNCHLEKSDFKHIHRVDHDAWQLAHESDSLVAKVGIIREMKRLLLGDDYADRRLLTEDDVFPLERMKTFGEWCISNVVDINIKFNLRDQATTMPHPTKTAKHVFNKVNSIWGFAKLEKDKYRTTRMMGGKQVDDTPYRIRANIGMGGLSLREMNALIR
jgi:hypothetical protein